MALMDKLRGEHIDIIEHLDDSRDTIVWRFPRYADEIKNGAKLVVRESQVAVFVNEGTIADVFVPGTYELSTANLPVLSTLKGWKYGFASPFKAEVYFVTTRQFSDLKWGTQNPAMMRDPEFGVVRVRAFGTYTVAVADPAVLLRELVGTDAEFTTDEVDEFIRQSVVSRVVGALATSGVGVVDLAAHQNEIAQHLAAILSQDLKHLGLKLPQFVIENVSLPAEVEAALDKRTEIGVLGDLDKFTKLQAAEAITSAAANPAGLASAGVGIGLGASLGAQLAQALKPGIAPSATPVAPPPLPGTTEWYVAIDGAQVGPLAPAEVQSRLASGAVTEETLTWKAGMREWTRLRDVSELAPTEPPPIPRTSHRKR